MQTNVAVGLTSLKNQIQASGDERRTLVPRMHQKSPFGDPNGKNIYTEGALPPPQTSPSVERGTPPPHTSPPRRLVLSVPLPLILQFDH